MSNFDDFDLDLQNIKATGKEGHTPNTITTIIYTPSWINQCPTDVDCNITPHCTETLSREYCPESV